MSLKTLTEEWKDLESDPPESYNASPIDEDMYHWRATIMGPPDTPYDGGVWFLDIEFPQKYPSIPPQIQWETKIYHPSIAWDTNIELSKSQYVEKIQFVISYWQEKNMIEYSVNDIDNLVITYLGDYHHKDITQQPVFRHYYLRSGWSSSFNLSKILQIIYDMLRLQSVTCPIGGKMCNWNASLRKFEGWTKKQQICSPFISAEYAAFRDYWYDRQKFIKIATEWKIKYAQ